MHHCALIVLTNFSHSCFSWCWLLKFTSLRTIYYWFLIFCINMVELIVISARNKIFLVVINDNQICIKNVLESLYRWVVLQFVKWFYYKQGFVRAGINLKVPNDTNFFWDTFFYFLWLKLSSWTYPTHTRQKVGKTHLCERRHIFENVFFPIAGNNFGLKSNEKPTNEIIA